MTRSRENWIINNPRQQAQGKQPRGIEKRSQQSVRESARLKNIQQKLEVENKNIESKPALPSPSTSNTLSQKIPQDSPVLPKAIISSKWTRRSSPDFNLEEIQQSCSQNGRGSIKNLHRKRKRSPESEDLIPQVQSEPIDKRARISLPNTSTGSKEGAEASDIINSPIEYWSKTGNWPKKFFESDPNMSQQLTKKRSSSAMSYSQGVREGEYPPAHTPAYEKQILEPAGIILSRQFGETAISDDCKQLCVHLLDAKYEAPKNSLFEENIFWKVLEGVRSRNEARVVRDILPWLIPSAELLFMRGFSGFKDLTEEIQAEWKCVSLAGPLPKPDFTVGYRSSAFTNDEIEKFKYHSAPEKPTLFVGDLYFPFLICEAKCGENGLNIADRQNARSASTAVNAILQLYSAVSRVEQLHRKILVFSVSHDHQMIQIYGHYALIGKDKSTFHRHLVHNFNFTVYEGKDRWTAYNFIRKLYDHFAPIHLQKIRDAVALLKPASESLISFDTAEEESEFADSQEISAPASQDNEAFKKPSLPSKKKRRNKDTEIAVLQRELELAKQTPSDASSGKWQQEIDRKDEQIDQLIALLKQQTPSDASSGQNKDTEINVLQRELERQRVEAKQREDQLREEIAQEKDERKKRHAELMEQNKKLIDLLSKG